MGYTTCGRPVALISFLSIFTSMAKVRSRSEDDLAAKRGMNKLRELLVDPEKFEEWANEMLDSSARRKH